MHGEPFRNMLIAAETFIGQLRDGDRVSVVAFSNGVYLAAPPVIIDGNTRNLVITGIRSLVDGGGTNLGGGFLAGLAQVFGAFNPWQVNQVVLFSDGQPNIGITSSSELARIAARAAEHGVAVTTIGFGMEHDELLMQGMADASGGNYYYVDSPDDMPRIFQQEAGAILRTAARIDRRRPGAAAGLQLEDVIGYDYVTAGGHTYVRIGSVPHDQERFVAFRFQRRERRPASDRASSTRTSRGAGASACRARPATTARAGGRDNWALELAGRAEAALGPAGIDGLGRQRQRGVRHLADRLHARHHRDDARAAGPAGARRRGQDAARRAGRTWASRSATEAAKSFMSGGVGGLMNFGKQQAVSNATTAVAYNIDKTFQHARAHHRAGQLQRRVGTRYVARGTTYKPRDRDASLRFKRARYSSYRMMRTR